MRDPDRVVCGTDALHERGVELRELGQRSCSGVESLDRFVPFDEPDGPGSGGDSIGESRGRHRRVWLAGCRVDANDGTLERYPGCAVARGDAGSLAAVTLDVRTRDPGREANLVRCRIDQGDVGREPAVA